MEIKHYEKKAPLDSSLDDFIITWVDIGGGAKKVVAFSVSQVAHYGGQVHNIVRFDTSHEYCHVHKFYKQLNPPRERINKEISDKTFYECRKDVKENWKKYKKAYFEKLIK